MKRSVIFAGLTLLFIASVIGGLYLGYADLSLGEILHALSRGLAGKGGDDVAYAIVMDIRLPRVLLAILTGVALAVSGLIMQAVVGNPIADPYILGISSGASLGATLAIVLGLMSALGNVAVGISAFLFALLTSVGVMILSRIGGRVTSERLILSGLALSAATSSIATLFGLHGEKPRRHSGSEFLAHGLLIRREDESDRLHRAGDPYPLYLSRHPKPQFKSAALGR